VLVATWQDGLFVVGDTLNQEFRGQSIRSLAPDGRGGALAIVDGRARALCRRAPDGAWITIATTELELSCCVAGRDAWYAGSAVINGQRVGPPLGIRSITATADGTVLLANVHVGGIPRSTDGGGLPEWIGGIADTRCIATHGSAAAIVDRQGNLYLSMDTGRSWSRRADGLTAPSSVLIV